jgi:L-iditol 2-dehydrogenase
MKSLRLHAPGDLQLHNEPVPRPNLGECLVQVKSVGICGSDLHWFSEAGIGDARLEQPLILGHEFAAVTEDGQRVAVDPSIPCGKCEYCRAGNPNFCSSLIFAGHGQEDGALREYIAWPERCLFPLPDTLSDAEGVMLEPLGVAIHAVDLGKLKVGMSVGVFGCGPIGLLILQLARLSGAQAVYVTDILPHRLDAARALGATSAILAGNGSEVPEIMAATGGRGVDVAFEVAGENAAVEAAIAAVRPGGRVLLVGIPADDRTSFSASVARRKGLTIKLVRRMKHTYPRAIQLVESGQVDVRSLVTHRFPLEKSMEAFSLAQRREGLKVIIEIG